MHEIQDRSNDHELFLAQLQALIADETDLLANMANMASLIYFTFSDLNWVGFYFAKDNQLVLGPFMGRPACTRVRFDQGVCGKAARTREVQNIADVHLFDGHIACDTNSNSELVVPMIKNGALLGVLDIDSIAFDRFGEKSQKTMSQAVRILLER